MSTPTHVSSRSRFTRRGALASGLALLAGCTSSRSTRSPGSTGSTAPSTPRGTARLGFAGDVMFGRNVDEAQADRAPGAVWGDVRPRLEALDGLLCNLECCLSTRGKRAPNRAYYFRADPAWAVPALEAANVAWAGLANNHVLDFGRLALSDTLAALRAADIPTAGAGEDRQEAFEPARVRVGDLDVAVLAVTDQAPTYAAGAIQPGTAFLPMLGDPATDRLTRLALSTAIEAALEADPDLLAVSLHWEPNWVTSPADRYRRLAHWLVEAGADVVHGHSAHVPQGVEVYRGRPILHDCGDFVDDYALVGDLHNDRSFLFELGVEDGRPVELVARPVELEDEAVHLAGDEAASWVRGRLRSRSAPFGTTFRRRGPALVCELSPET